MRNWIKTYLRETLEKVLTKPKLEFGNGGDIERRKKKQLEIINKTNPAPNNYNTWIRKVEDIKTADEVFNIAKEEGVIYPDFTEKQIQDALDSGEIIVYSSYPIQNGVFVTPSKMEAQTYAGGKGDKVYSKKVKLEDVAWIDDGQGQYASIESVEQSLKETPKPKPVFGSGQYHKLYRSNQFPDRLYKIGDEDSVDEWLPIFQANPKYFPKVYRVFPYKKDSKLKVVEIEMLDTSKAKIELDKLDSFLLNISDQVDCDGEFITTLNFFESSCIDTVVEAANKTNQPEILPLLYKWAEFLSVVVQIVERDLARTLDLHIENVAYDKEGNLKMIDI